jgi:hypothetical protein
MTRQFWTNLTHSLVCIRLGQELGTDTELAQAVAGAVELLLKAAAAFSG